MELQHVCKGKCEARRHWNGEIGISHSANTKVMVGLSAFMNYNKGSNNASENRISLERNTGIVVVVAYYYIKYPVGSNISRSHEFQQHARVPQYNKFICQPSFCFFAAGFVVALVLVPVMLVALAALAVVVVPFFVEGAL